MKGETRPRIWWQILQPEDFEPRTSGSGLRLRVPGPAGPLGRLCRPVPALLAPFEVRTHPLHPVALSRETDPPRAGQR